MDPLSQVYTGQDNSGAAIIYKDATPDPIPTVLAILEKKAAMAHQLKLAALKANKQPNYKDTPAFVGGTQDTPYLTKLRNDVIQKSRGLYDGSLTPDEKIQLNMELDQAKGHGLMMAHKSAKLEEINQKQLQDFYQRPYAYYPDTEKKIKENIDTPLEDRTPLTLDKRNESDYRKSMEGVDVAKQVRAWDEDIAAGRMKRTEVQNLTNKAIDMGWKTWRANTNDPNVMALYDHADEELRKQYGDKYDQMPLEEKHKAIDKMGKAMFTEVQLAKAGDVYKTGIKNAPKGAVTKQKTIDEMDNIQYDNKYNTTDKTGTAKTAASYTIVEPKKNIAVLQLSSDMYDPLTRSKITETGPVSFTPGQIHVGNHKTLDKKSGESTIVAEAFVTGTYKKTIPVLDKEGKQVVNFGKPLTKDVEKSIIVPLKDMEGIFKENGEQYQWAYDLSDRLNNEKISGKKDAGFDYSKIKY